MRGKQSPKKALASKGILIIILGTVVAFSFYSYMQQKKYDNVIYKGVYVENINLEGKKLSEAEVLLQNKFSENIANKKIEIMVNNRPYSLNYSELKAEYNVSEVAKEAFNYSKSGNIFYRYFLPFNSANKNLKLTLSYDEKPIDELITLIEKENNKEPINASLSVINGTIKVNPEKNGTKLKSEDLKKNILLQISNNNVAEVQTINAPMDTIKPEAASEKLSSINSLVSSFSTSFTTSTADRINNINLATKAINGTLLMPGQIFSFNETVGERTKSRGYKEAGVIVGDQVESGLGGGICQVSSTLYNAVLGTSLKATERTNHSLPLSYVDKGLDATVDWGHLDFKFKNTLNNPIYIEGFTKGKKVFFNIYSNSRIAEKTYKMETNIISVTEPIISYTDDPNLNEGETKVIKKASTGYKIEVYRKTFEKGKLIDKELISKDTYKVVNGEIVKGTKKASPVVLEPTINQINPAQPPSNLTGNEATASIQPIQN